MNKVILFVIGILLCLNVNLFAQQNKLKVFLDCNEQWLCDQEFLRNELPIIDFVRDRFLCDVQVISAVNFTQSGGESNFLNFIGQKNYTGKADTITYFNDVTTTNDIKRKKMLKNLQIGLLPYLMKNQGDDAFLEINFKKDTSSSSNKATIDPWNYFQFSIGSSGFFNGDRNTSSANISNSLNISRETTKSRFSVEFFNQIRRNKFTFYNTQFDTTEVIKVVNDNQFVFARYIVKANEHWGYGFRSNFERSIFNNIDSRIAFFPQIEYSVYPYKDYNTTRLVFQYSIGMVNFNYRDTTIYLKTTEHLYRQDFDAVIDFTKPWGNISLGSSFTHYLHDFSKNNLFVGGAVSWNIFKGFKFSIGGNLQLLRDQLSLPKANATRDDLLTQRRVIASSYDYFGGVGFSYTFGSIFNSQVHQTFRGLNWGLSF